MPRITSNTWRAPGATLRPSSMGMLGLIGTQLVSGCKGPQSALDPAGREASRIAELFWGMTIGGAVIWLGFVSLTLYAAYSTRQHGYGASRSLIIGGGVVFPVILLGGLLTYGLSMLPDLLAPAPEGTLRIQVTGEQWWWRVRYLPQGRQAVDLANEIHLPVGEAVEFELESPDVIHSFWVPSLGGKMDMIPGRRTRLRLEPTKVGVYRGACAEYCGTSHAWMSFFVVVEEKQEFEAWLARQAAPALPTAGPSAAYGAERFLANGCGACHTIRGTNANGVIGPDLTHVGSRLSLGAGVLPNETAAFRRWVAHTTEVKPGVRMPPFHMLPVEELRALTVYLESLK